MSYEPIDEEEKQARRNDLDFLIVGENPSKRKKEVIQPQVPLRLPCDDLTHLTELRFNVLKKARFT